MIILRNKEFSSKAQKARRRKFDFQVAKESGRINPKQYFDPDARKIGREVSKGVDVWKSDPGNVNKKASGALGELNTRADNRQALVRVSSLKSDKAKNLQDKMWRKAKISSYKDVAKTVGKGAAAAAAVAGTAYGAKKLYDKKKKENKD